MEYPKSKKAASMPEEKKKKSSERRNIRCKRDKLQINH